jgi:hypothetical protein
VLRTVHRKWLRVPIAEPIGSVAHIGERMLSVVPISLNAPRSCDESAGDGSAQSERLVDIA